MDFPSQKPEGSTPDLTIVISPAIPNPAPVRQRISQPKDANVRFNLTLNGFIINHLRKARHATTEELLALAKAHLTSLRRIDGSQYKPTFTRVFFGTLERCPAFKKLGEEWIVDDVEAEKYKHDILRHIHRRLARTTRKHMMEQKVISGEQVAHAPALKIEYDPCGVKTLTRLLRFFPERETVITIPMFP